MVQILKMHGKLFVIKKQYMVCSKLVGSLSVFNSSLTLPLGVENYPSHDVLEDVDFKEAMKEYS